MTTENRKLDMSLDEIIRMDGIKGARRGGGGFSANRRRGGGGQIGNSGDRRPYQAKRLNNSGPYNNRNHRTGGLYGGQQSRGYQSSGGRMNRQTNGFGGRSSGRNITLHVSNLASTVNTEDIEELFSTFGVLVRSMVHYDQYGTSLGTAEVIFEQRDDANEARNKLNSVPLDGKPLRISMIDDDGSANDPFSSSLRRAQQQPDQRQRNGGFSGGRNSNNFQNNDRRSNSNNRNTGRQNGGGGGRGGRRTGPPTSAEDLDKEMDEWRMQVDDGTGAKADESGDLDL